MIIDESYYQIIFILLSDPCMEAILSKNERIHQNHAVSDESFLHSAKKFSPKVENSFWK